MQITGTVVRLNVTADIGTPCVVQYSTNLTLLANPSTIIDTKSATNSRFYRALIAIQTNMIWVPPGTFTMGSPTNETQRGPNSETQHSVTLTKGFFMSKYTVTQAAYRSLMSTNPSYFNTNHGFTLDLNRPVEQVSWSDATNYCRLLTIQERNAGEIRTDARVAQMSR